MGDSTSSTNTSTSGYIDKSLLRGLDPVMTTQEQAQLTAMLVSGDTSMLAQAAKVFYELGVLLEHGVHTVAQRTSKQHTKITDSFRSSFTSAASVAAAAAPLSQTPANINRAGYNDYETRVAEEKKQADQERKELGYDLPLPVRMPRLVVIDVFDPDCDVDGSTLLEGNDCNKKNNNKKKLLNVIGGDHHSRPTLKFVDYEWDGTLGTAFTKLHVKHGTKGGGGAATAAQFKNVLVRQRRRRSDSSGRFVHVEAEPMYPTAGYDEIVDRAGGYDVRVMGVGESSDLCGSSTSAAADGACSGRPTLATTMMVLIAETHNDACKVAIKRGDVVTHVNGREFVGTSNDLKMLVKSHYSSTRDGDHGNKKLEIVVNAELCVAQALKLRSFVQ
jgi:hypothetical protein